MCMHMHVHVPICNTKQTFSPEHETLASTKIGNIGTQFSISTGIQTHA